MTNVSFVTKLLIRQRMKCILNNAKRVISIHETIVMAFHINTRLFRYLAQILTFILLSHTAVIYYNILNS